MSDENPTSHCIKRSKSVKPACTEEKFLKDVSKHQMKIIRDDSVNRHLKFRRPYSVTYCFDLVTWPGHLCITGGDSGTYVFRCVEDMFDFFRTGIRDGALKINPEYWSEKAVAVDRTGGVEKFSAERFRENIKQYFEDHFDFFDYKGPQEECWAEIEDQILSCASNAFEAFNAVCNFEYDGFFFEGFWEMSANEYDWRFLWNLYAIVWGVKQYDEFKLYAEKPARTG